MPKVLAIEPYYGGSHKAFIDGYRAHSGLEMDLIRMPARKWKWRMRGAALEVGRLLPAVGPDVVLASDFLDLAALVGQRREVLATVPCAAYFHENQLTYPLLEESERDYQFGFTNITTCMAADSVIFNSAYHMEEFLGGVERLLKRMPDCVPHGVPEAIRGKATVVPPGVDFEAVSRARATAAPRTGPLRVLWNHRWEFDKGPEAFFSVMGRLADEGCEFELAVLGETFSQWPAIFDEARERFARQLRAFGYVESRQEYLRVLAESDVVVSTALHEFFGLAVVEAICAGCAPLLPRRLSYPEILPEHAHGMHLYGSLEELGDWLSRWMARPQEARSMDLSEAMRKFDWADVAPRLDAVLEGLARPEIQRPTAHP